MTELLATGIGLTFGWAAQRGQFCLNSGFAGLARGRELEKVRSFGLALSLAAVVIGIVRLFATSNTAPTASLATAVPTPAGLLYGIVGGLIFGASMPVASGCASGIWMRLGEGRLSAFGAIAGFSLALGILPRVLSGPPTARYSGSSSFFVSMWIISALLAFVLLWRAGGAAAAGAIWTDRRTGITLGLLAGGTWLANQYTALPAFAIVPGMLDAGSYMIAFDVTLTPALLLVLGIPVGALLSARTRGTFSLRFPTWGELVRSFAGGIGLGTGAFVAGGCTVGYGLGLAPLGAVDAFIVLLAIFLGRALPARLSPLPRPA